MWYYGTYQCGHEGRVDIIGPTKDRQRKADYKFSGLCPECYQVWLEEKRKKEHEKSLEMTKEMDLPELTGTEKQTVWATTLRVQFAELVSAALSDASSKNKKTIPIRNAEHTKTLLLTIDEILEAVDLGYRNHTDASFWIENRNQSPVILFCFCDEYLQSGECDTIPKEVKDELALQRKGLTVKPEHSSKDGVVHLYYSEKEEALAAEYVKDSDFIEIVKSKGYSWDGRTWKKQISERTGTLDDRSADLGNALLSSGFTVEFINEQQRDLAIAGSFQPECRRWIIYKKDHNRFAVLWDGRDNDMYEAAKKLPGAKWEGRAMLVPVEFYSQVEDFAETLGFSFTQKALAAIKEYQEKEASFERSSINTVDLSTDSAKELLKRQLSSGGTILEDLKDEP